MQTNKMKDEPLFPLPAQVDYQDPKQIIEHLRALLDLHDLLEKGYDYELQSFRVHLREVGWGLNQISEFILQSSFHTRYEALVDPPIPSRGSQFEFDNNSYRWRH